MRTATATATRPGTFVARWAAAGASSQVGGRPDAGAEGSSGDHQDARHEQGDGGGQQRQDPAAHSCFFARLGCTRIGSPGIFG